MRRPQSPDVACVCCKICMAFVDSAPANEWVLHLTIFITNKRIGVKKLIGFLPRAFYLLMMVLSDSFD